MQNKCVQSSVEGVATDIERHYNLLLTALYIGIGHVMWESTDCKDIGELLVDVMKLHLEFVVVVFSVFVYTDFANGQG